MLFIGRVIDENGSEAAATNQPRDDPSRQTYEKKEWSEK